MTEFERNQLELIRKQINEQVKLPKIGKVVQVYEHAASNDDSNWEVDVEVDGGTVKEQRVPVHTPASDAIAPPKYGDKVLVYYTEGATQRPVVFGTAWSNEDRPPLGLAGIYRNRFESGSSPMGDGDLHLTGYTRYDDSVASNDKRDVEPEESVVQITKHVEGENVDPSEDNDLPVKVEVRDSPADDAGHVSVELNGVNSNDTDITWGFKLDFKTGEFKLVDPNGYGIKSDGFGNLTFEYDTKTENQVSGGGSLSL